MFSQQLCCGMERDCYCCRPGPSLPFAAPAPYNMYEPLAVPVSSQQTQILASAGTAPQQLRPLIAASSQGAGVPQLGPTVQVRQVNKSMDMDLALSELDDLQISTGYSNDTSKFTKEFWTPSSEADDLYPGRRSRYRSFSESTSGLTQGLKQSSSESSLYKATAAESPVAAAAVIARAHGRRWLGSKPGCSLSLPRKIGAYHMVQRNATYVSDINAGRSGSPHSGCPWDSGVSSFSEQSSFSDSSPPCSMGVYRDSDLMEERARQRRMSRFRLDRSRRLRQPYSVPFRMCQSMNEDSTASLQDFLSTISVSQPSGSGSKSTTSSPVKPETGVSAMPPASGALKRSQSIDNLELSKLRLADSTADTPPKPTLLARSRETLEMEQVASNLKNMHLQLD